MTISSRAARFLSPFLVLALVAQAPVRAETQLPHPQIQPVPEQQLPQLADPLALPIPAATLPPPTTLKPDDPWIYRGTDIPHDQGWLFGELPNGLRYAVRNNQVPPGQVSIRVRIDAGSLNEKDSERGFAHLIEHLTFRESKYLANAQAIPTWQRLGARLGADTNANTSATETVYKLDLPNTDTAKLDESMKLLSGMIREPALSAANIAAEVPIVLAEKRDNGGPGRRVSDATGALFYKDQLLADRTPIGTDATLNAATSDGVRAFHDAWYRPENAVIVIAGDGNPRDFAALIERWFGDWQGKGAHVAAPDFGRPQAPAGADPANPVDGTKVLVEPDLPRQVMIGILRPWGKPADNLEMNRQRYIDQVALAIVNRRLEARARSGGSYVLANVGQQEISRSAEGTFINITPLGKDWRTAVRDVRAVIADAQSSPPTQAEIDREVAEIDVNYENYYQQRINQPGSQLADDLVGAVDIRESVASPETFLGIFRGMRDRFTPAAVFDHTKTLFTGTVTRGFLLTPDAADAKDEGALRQALLAKPAAAGNSRLAAQTISFATLPPIGKEQAAVARHQIGVLDIQQQDYANGVHALVWRTENEPGRVTVRVRFGSGFRGFSQQDAPYISLGQSALIASGLGSLDANDLDVAATGRKLGFDFDIEDGAFTLSADTRKEDLADQLYLFAAKLAQPRWDSAPVERAKALSQIGYDSLSSDPSSVIGRDLDYVVSDRDQRFHTPTPAEIAKTTPAGFRKVWEPLLRQGPVEVMVFGDIDPAATDTALAKTFGALPARDPIPADALARGVGFTPIPAAPIVLYHHGEADQAAAVVAWKLGGGVEGLAVSRQLDVLAEVFSNRLLDAMREAAGASYTPFVNSTWPADVDSGGRMIAVAQLKPEMVPRFFAVADKIAADLAATGPTADELERVTEPFKQLLNRVVNGHQFWMDLVGGSTIEPGRLKQLPSLMDDYTAITPQRVQELAKQYLPAGQGLRIAVIPQGQQLATAIEPLPAGSPAAVR
ncbi:MAG: insulinase family protein [Candidatus Andeanibacterium colombiense]|uniref:Insulinase family protein n=1 Tax=Candidatus Andeanibacterium colombiense TaxID=3121345 RepID=A0AAJ5X8E4_9SPHN|nr:MAG: insulinase family protein [Sphingomonadaceae bacterium]